jgi:hypothetical protein
MDLQSPRNHTRANSIGIAITGLVVVTFGLTLLANNLGWTEPHRVLSQLWPLGLVVLGIGALLRGSDSQRQNRSFWGVALILAGLWAYAGQQQWVRVNFWAVFGPTLIVLLGGSVIWRAISRPRPAVEGTEAYIRTFAMFSGSDLRPTTAFQGAEITAILGGAKLDLTTATMAGDSATIDIFAMMGGVEILVPRDWDVTIKVVSIMGGCSDKRRPSTVPGAKRLVIQGTALMGGVEIKD